MTQVPRQPNRTAIGEEDIRNRRWRQPLFGEDKN